MYGTFIAQKWKQSIRHSAFRQNWGVKILVGFLVLYFSFAFLTLGIFMPEILQDLNPEAKSILPHFAEGVLYYALADLVMRYFLQDLNVLSVQHYLILPIKKSKVLHFFLQSSVLNFFNLLPLFIIVPFAFRGVGDELGMLHGITWLVGMLGVVLTNHFLAIYLKRVIAVDIRIFIAAALVVLFAFVGNFAGWFSLNTASEVVYHPLATQLWAFVLPFIPVALLYQLNYRFLFNFTYLDQWQSEGGTANEEQFSFIESRGLVGTLIANELKLIARNKRTRAILLTGVLLAFYGLIFYTQDEYVNGYGWLLFVGIFMTGIMMINYGQFLVSWESAYFDGILTRSLSIKEYYRGKFWLLAAFTLAMYLLTLPYMYFGMKALYINTAALIYNLGINSFVILFSSTYNKKAIDLSKGAAFNYQGTSAVQFVIVLPLIVVPILIFQGFNLFDLPHVGLMVLAGLGLIGLLSKNYLLNEVVKNFYEKKYDKAEGYREN